MSEEKEFTYAEVSEHSVKKDLWVVIYDKVYSCASFIDEHPGGEEVLMDLAGQDATDSFEDVGHSDEAREILKGLLIGKLKRTDADPKPNLTQPSAANANSSSTDAGTTLYAFFLAAALVAFGAYKYLQGA